MMPFILIFLVTFALASFISMVWFLVACRRLLAKNVELAMLLRFTEIRKEAVEIHCEELRTVVAQLAHRNTNVQLAPIELTEEQVKELASAIVKARVH